MRASIDFFVSANSTSEMKEKVVAEWRRLTNDPKAEIPSATEVRMRQEKEGDSTYMVYVTVRAKVGE